ncbi:hypothetical protein EMCRGX_G019582 [Ephydatia muelleri]
MSKDVIVQVIVVPMECVCQTQAGAMGRMTVEMEVMNMAVDPAIQMTSYAKMEGVLVHPLCATITMTVETTVMNLDATPKKIYSATSCPAPSSIFILDTPLSEFLRPPLEEIHEFQGSIVVRVPLEHSTSQAVNTSFYHEIDANL